MGPIPQPIPRPSRRRGAFGLGILCAAGLAVACGRPDAGPHAAELQEAAGAGALAPESDEPSQTGATAPVQRPRTDDVDATARAARDAHLARRIESAVANAVAKARDQSEGEVHGGNVVVAVHVTELEGTERVARLADHPLRPASNMKLVTVAAALALLGLEARFETPFEAAGTIENGRLSGDLVARAGGDPLHALEGDGALDPWLNTLADQLRAAGIESVSGALVLDEGTYLEPGPGPAWPSSAEYWKSYCALAGGFSANAGCLTAIVRPGRVDEVAEVDIFPRAHGLPRIGSVMTTAPGTDLVVAVGATTSGVTVRGSIPAGTAPYDASFAYPDPVLLFGHAVQGGLAERGITLEGGLRRQRDAAGGPRVATLSSPVRDTLVPILTHSNNSVSDQLFFTVGQRVAGAGTREGAASATRQALTSLGVDVEGFVQVDGSGLSRDDRITARQLSALVRHVLAGPTDAAAAFRAALAESGETGTLARRMTGALRGRVHAKTGFIGGTSALSGVVESVAGPHFVFSILVSYPRFSGLNTQCWKPMQDAICAEIADLDV